MSDDSSKKDATISSADDLVKTTKSGDVELSEEQLKQVTGGGKQIAGVKYEDITVNCPPPPTP